jgi:hypothetical protein
MFKNQRMDIERSLDIVMTVFPLPVTLWMVFVGNPVSALGTVSCSAIALMRLISIRVQQWTNQHQWLFLGILTLILIPTVVDAMP